MHLMWFRNDLRIHDNTALSFCSEEQEAVEAVYVICPQLWQHHDVAPIRIDFILKNLQALQTSLQSLSIPLHFLSVEKHEDIPNIFTDFVLQRGFKKVFANRQYEINEKKRDAIIHKNLSKQQIDFNTFDDDTILPPGSVLKDDRAPYTVFTAFKKKWQQVQLTQSLIPKTAPQPRTAHPFTHNHTLPHILSNIDSSHWPAGEKAAQQRLETFVNHAIFQYQQHRDIPSIDGTSALSPYLANGIISARHCFHAASHLLAENTTAEKMGISTWINELIWRDFYKHILSAFPFVSMHEPFQKNTRHIIWRESPKDFMAWCHGQTGYPIVDAAMRQLNTSGWMHNRLRMVVAMFLTKDLFLDWRLGERYFMQHLIDGDLAANNGGWQWCASTGTDAAPYFRIFNPVLQSQRFDPDGDFIRHYCPELGSLNKKHIHAPWTAPMEQRQALHYPSPIVDRRIVLSRVKQAFAGLRNQPNPTTS